MNRVPDLGASQSAVCGKCRAPLERFKGPVTVDDATFERLLGSDRPVIVDFWADWCGPCHMMAPVFEQLAAERSDLLFAKIDIDRNQQTAGRYRVSSIPTLIFFSGAAERGRLVGAQGRGQIEQAISRYFGSR
jgi:thioredoxin